MLGHEKVCELGIRLVSLKEPMWANVWESLLEIALVFESALEKVQWAKELGK
jgi:hypothetical protein